MNALVASCLAVFWLSIFVVPLQSSLFQVRLMDVGGHRTWRWIVVEPVLWSSVGIWSTITVSVLALCFFFGGRRTGLKWDPVSLAEYLLCCNDQTLSLTFPVQKPSKATSLPRTI
jgi:hypothetical protein